LFAAVLAAPLLFIASTASAAADRAACGNIELVAAGECHLDVTGGCATRCTPLNFTAACEGQCNVTIDASCSASCSTACEAKCNVKPATFDCAASCELDCGASCMGSCSAQSNKADCSTYCQGRCKNDCSAQCKVVPPSADCKAQCKGSCSGSCQAQASADCNYKCSSMLTGGCQTDCTEPKGALFCDGQYIQATNLDDCVAYLESQFKLNIDYEASGHCDNVNGCEGSASASVGCTAAPTGSAPFDVAAIAAMAVGVGFAASRRRRRA
jgi:hypothetical protein